MHIIIMTIQPSAHIGQFWNVDINIQNFNGTLRRGESIDNVFIITIKPPKTDARSFPAWLEQKVHNNI